MRAVRGLVQRHRHRTGTGTGTGIEPDNRPGSPARAVTMTIGTFEAHLGMGATPGSHRRRVNLGGVGAQ